MLIAAHAKFFDKTYYKMIDPYIGKKTDVLNKLAIANLFRGNIDDAEEYWSQSIGKGDSGGLVGMGGTPSSPDAVIGAAAKLTSGAAEGG